MRLRKMTSDYNIKLQELELFVKNLKNYNGVSPYIEDFLKALSNKGLLKSVNLLEDKLIEEKQ